MSVEQNQGMILRLLAASSVLILAAPASATQPGKRVTKVDVEGKTYRVRISGQTAKANGAGMWTNPEDPAYFVRAKRAVELATGCAVKDTFTTSNILVATLDCAN